MGRSGLVGRLGRILSVSKVIGTLALTYVVGVGTGLGLPTLASTGSRPIAPASPRLSVGDIIAANAAAAAWLPAGPRLSVGDIIAANQAAAQARH